MKKGGFIFLCLILLASCGKSQKAKEQELVAACENLAKEIYKKNWPNNSISQISLKSIVDGKSGYEVAMSAKSQNAIGTKDTNIECTLVYDGTPPSFDQYLETIGLKIDSKTIDLH